MPRKSQQQKGKCKLSTILGCTAGSLEYHQPLIVFRLFNLKNTLYLPFPSAADPDKTSLCSDFLSV
ncbi:hypothetical protein [Chryseobacterium luteum]|uniref:Uncharacterized protein n=1 Tax=Chryseobacterium luteum TaxID=421531 RepID=A0A085ZUD9_9FLAO|nr:hypothetical protein [Chryseobacterium luteum]KFF08053.1 hypothetical protein IX38_07815 [Chryseobacterium luteum]